MDQKKRILIVNESSHLFSGFSKMGKGLLERLYDTGKYELAELACYLDPNHPYQLSVPWKVYPAIPPESDELGRQGYSSQRNGQYGSAVFEQVLLDFRPTHLYSHLDAWMLSYHQDSPFRKYFKWIIAATVDSSPQKLEWLETYSKSDCFIPYARYAKEVIEKESGGKIKCFDLLRMGVDTTIHKPLNKNELRKEFGIPEDAFIINTVMRNQRRKLFPDLIESFAKYLKYCKDKGREDLLKKTFLHLHTSIVDVGFDIGRHILQNGVGHKVLITYSCKNCRHLFIDFFQGEVSTCSRCGKLAASSPNTGDGITEQDLCKIYNLSDLYVQISVAEALALPLSESRACGIPVMATDYASMSEQAETEGCQKLKVGQLFHEPITETEQTRALTDHQDIVEKWFEFFNKTQEERNRYGLLAMKDAVDNYSFDRAAGIVMKAVDSTENLSDEETWLSDLKQLDIPTTNQIPLNQFRSNSDLVDWAIENILHKPDLLGSYWRGEQIKGINVGYIVDGGGRRVFTQKDFLNDCIRTSHFYNLWEKRRDEWNHRNDPKEDVVRWSLI